MASIFFFFCIWLDLSTTDFFCIQNNLKILGSADCVAHVTSCNPFWKFSRLKIRHGIFWGVHFWSRVFGVLLEALGIFLGFDFCPHSIIPVTRNLESPPPPVTQYPKRKYSRLLITRTFKGNRKRFRLSRAKL